MAGQLVATRRSSANSKPRLPLTVLLLPVERGVPGFYPDATARSEAPLGQPSW